MKSIDMITLTSAGHCPVRTSRLGRQARRQMATLDSPGALVANSFSRFYACPLWSIVMSTYDVHFDQHDEIETLNLLKATLEDVDAECNEYETGLADLISHLKCASDEVVDHVQLDVAWSGVIDDHVVLYFQFKEAVKSVEVNCDNTCCIDDESNSVAIKLNFDHLEKEFAINISMMSGTVARLSGYRIDSKKLVEAPKNEKALFLVGSRLQYDVSSFAEDVQSGLTGFQKMVNDFMAYLSSTADGEIILTITYVREEHIALFHKWAKVSYDVDLKNHRHEKPLKDHLGACLRRELDFIASSVDAAQKNYDDFRIKLLKLEEQTDSAIACLL